MSGRASPFLALGRPQDDSKNGMLPFQQFVGLQCLVDLAVNHCDSSACDISVVPQSDFLQSTASASSIPLPSPRSVSRPPPSLERSKSKQQLLSPRRASMTRRFSLRRLSVDVGPNSIAGSDDEQESSGYRSDDASPPLQSPSLHKRDSSSMHARADPLYMEEQNCLKIFESILTGSTAECRQSIGIQFQSISVMENSLHELAIDLSFIHSKTLGRRAVHGSPSAASASLQHTGVIICCVRLISPTAKWRYDLPCHLTSATPSLYAHLLIPRNVHVVNCEVLFHETSIFKRKETSITIHTHKCFLRAIKGAHSVEKAFAFSSDSNTNTKLATAQQQPNRWSLLHQVVDEVIVIRHPLTPLTDSEYLRWELLRSGIHFTVHESRDTQPLTHGAKSTPCKGADCATCFWKYHP